MDPIGCGPLGGSVTTVTEYTVSVDTLCQHIELHYHSLSFVKGFTKMQRFQNMN